MAPGRATRNRIPDPVSSTSHGQRTPAPIPTNEFQSPQPSVMTSGTVAAPAAARRTKNVYSLGAAVNETVALAPIVACRLADRRRDRSEPSGLVGEIDRASVGDRGNDQLDDRSERGLILE